MEVILSTAFGRAIDVQGGNGGKLYEAALEAFASIAPSADNQMTFTRILQFLICEPACCITVQDCIWIECLYVVIMLKVLQLVLYNELCLFYIFNPNSILFVFGNSSAMDSDQLHPTW